MTRGNTSVDDLIRKCFWEEQFFFDALVIFVPLMIIFQGQCFVAVDPSAFCPGF